MVLRYINPNNDSVVGKITITPDNPSDSEQVHQVLFKPSRQPAFVTVAGPTSSIPSPLVMNPGQWSVSIKNDKSIFLVSVIFFMKIFCLFPLSHIMQIIVPVVSPIKT